MQEQREKKGRNLFSIIVIICVVVVLVVGGIIWSRWEAAHKDELKSFVVTAETPAGPIESSSEPTTSEEARPELPTDPKALLAMAEEALKDEGFFETDKSSASKGFRVYYLLNKALDCNCDVQKAEELCQRLKECSAKSNYGTWFVGNDLFAELDEKIKTVKES